MFRLPAGARITHRLAGRSGRQCRLVPQSAQRFRSLEFVRLQLSQVHTVRSMVVMSPFLLTGRRSGPASPVGTGLTSAARTPTLGGPGDGEVSGGKRLAYAARGLVS